MIVDRVSLGNVEVKFTHKHDALIIEWPAALKKDAKADLSIEYHGIPAGGLKIGPTKFGDRSFFNENWPNLTRHWLPCIDHPYDKATSEFRVTAPRHYKVVSNGLLWKSQTSTRKIILHTGSNPFPFQVGCLYWASPNLPYSVLAPSMEKRYKPGCTPKTRR
jgi:aminopeptidase N